jgi:hypothetical protein
VSRRNGKGRKSTPQERAAGRANLVAFREKNPRPALSSGVYSAIANGEIPDIPGSDEIKLRVAARIEGYIADLGGEDNVASGQRVILDGIRVALLVQGLCEAYLSNTGLVDRRRRPSALLKTLGTFINSARLGCVALGLDRKARRIGPATLREYLEIAGPDEPIQAPPENALQEPESPSQVTE